MRFGKILSTNGEHILKMESTSYADVNVILSAALRVILPPPPSPPAGNVGNLLCFHMLAHNIVCKIAEEMSGGKCGQERESRLTRMGACQS